MMRGVCPICGKGLNYSSKKNGKAAMPAHTNAKNPSITDPSFTVQEAQSYGSAAAGSGDDAPSRNAARDGSPSAATAGPDAELVERLARIKELRAAEEKLRKERESLEIKTAAQEPPIVLLERFRGPRPGFNYSTWFKAFGTFGDLRDMGDSPHLLGEIEELEDFDVPAAFYSSTILGQVKWKGLRSRKKVIDDLNNVAPWNGSDFRDVYPKWEYRYYIAEMVGDVVVRIYEHKARQPWNRSARDMGFKGR